MAPGQGYPVRIRCVLRAYICRAGGSVLGIEGLRPRNLDDMHGVNILSFLRDLSRQFARARLGNPVLPDLLLVSTDGQNWMFESRVIPWQKNLPASISLTRSVDPCAPRQKYQAGRHYTRFPQFTQYSCRVPSEVFLVIGVSCKIFFANINTKFRILV